MRERLRYWGKYLQYLFRSKHRRGYGIHSPSLFYLVSKIIEDDNSYYCFDKVESLRTFLIKTNKEIPTEGEGGKRKVKDLIKSQNFSPVYDQLLFRLVNHFKPRTVLEVGDTIGLSTLYLALSDSRRNIYSVGDSAELSRFSCQLLKKNDIENVHLKHGVEKDNIRRILKEMAVVDFIYFGREVTSEKIRMVSNALGELVTSQTVVIMSDIYRTSEKEHVWGELKKHPRVRVALELFHYGILICNEELQKEEFNLFFLPFLR